MPTPVFLSLSGQSQGAIEGSSTVTDREGQVEVLAFEHVVEIPPRRGSGVPYGKPVHGQVRIKKWLDRATPRLYQALLEEEPLAEALFTWYHFNASGQEEVLYTVRLENGRITRMQPWMPETFDPHSDHAWHMEAVSFAYEKIIWSWGPGGEVEFEDTWRSGEGG
ncbi:type VI secretion system tube protein TssD [Thiohalorhabdus methylotrophus]|uniref:Type VI secretion system tube protein TssD n=1 Tax=Thiohalorhabdus methylotrophus TaxID=3242694 RepID=A0ABV4TSY4_9GAMM